MTVLMYALNVDDRSQFPSKRFRGGIDEIALVIFGQLYRTNFRLAVDGFVFMV
jgi:hypothetical protein